MEFRRLLVARTGVTELRRRLSYGALRLVSGVENVRDADVEQPADRMHVGHHPSCPAATVAGATCIGCGPRLSVVA